MFAVTTLKIESVVLGKLCTLLLLLLLFDRLNTFLAANIRGGLFCKKFGAFHLKHFYKGLHAPLVFSC